MSLDEVIKKIGLLSSLDCQFYLASIISILEHLRQCKIIHRDIKPDNFIVDRDGYILLNDFSIVAPLKRANDRTNSNIGNFVMLIVIFRDTSLYGSRSDLE